MLDIKNVLKLKDDSFDKVIKTGVSLVDFWAEWCGPCRIQGQIREKVAEMTGYKARICKIDVDDNPKTAERFEVTNIPTSIIFKDDEIIERFIGLQSESVLVNALKKLF